MRKDSRCITMTKMFGGGHVTNCSCDYKNIVAVDTSTATFEELLDRSSLGTSEVKVMRAMAPSNVVQKVLKRADELNELTVVLSRVKDLEKQLQSFNEAVMPIFTNAHDTGSHVESWMTPLEYQTLNEISAAFDEYEDEGEKQ
jgi:hypothetical protein